MLDNEELTVRIIFDEEFEVDAITSFYRSLRVNDSNGSLVQPIDDTSMIDILDQAASPSAKARRVIYVMVNPLVIGMGLIVSFYALLVCIQSAANSATQERQGSSTHSRSRLGSSFRRKVESASHQKQLCSIGLVNYYLALYLISSIIYLLISGLSWLYWWSYEEHISSYNSFSCRVWQFLVRIFHELTLWMLLPPSWVIWCYLREGYGTLSCKKNNIRKLPGDQKNSLLTPDDADKNASSRYLREGTERASSGLRAPILAQLLVGVICSFVALMHMHGIWSHSLYQIPPDSARICTTHRKTGLFFSRIWPIIRFTLSTFLPTVLVVSFLGAATVICVRVYKLIKAIKTVSQAAVNPGRTLGNDIVQWFNDNVGPTEIIVMQYVAFWASFLRLQWCIANVYASILLLQSPAPWSTRTERSVNFVLTVSQIADKCSAVLCPLVICFVKWANASHGRCCNTKFRKFISQICARKPELRERRPAADA